ncbi:Ig-like domain-containing protein [Patescibacteria group bacterium]
MELDYKDELDKKIIRTSKGTKSKWGIFAPVHNLLRKNFRWYHNWHSRDYSRLVHIIVLIIYLIGYSAIALLIGLNLLSEYSKTQAAVYNETFTGTQYGEDYNDYYYDEDEEKWNEGETTALWDSKKGQLRLRDYGDGNFTGNNNEAKGVTSFNPRMTTDKMPHESENPDYAYVAWMSKVYSSEDGDIYLQKVKINTGLPVWGQAQKIVDTSNLDILMDLDYVEVEETSEEFLFLAYKFKQLELKGEQWEWIWHFKLKIIDVTNDLPLPEPDTLELTDENIYNEHAYDRAEKITGQINKYGNNTFYHFSATYSTSGLLRKIFYNRICADKDAGDFHCPTDGAVGAQPADWENFVYRSGATQTDAMVGGLNENYLEDDTRMQVNGNYIYWVWNSLLTNDVVPGFDGYRVIIGQKRNWRTGSGGWGQESGFGNIGGRKIDQFYGEYDPDNPDKGWQYQEKFPNDLVIRREGCDSDGDDCDMYVFWKVEEGDSWWQGDGDADGNGLIFGQKITGNTPDGGPLDFGWDGGDETDNCELIVSRNWNDSVEYDLRWGASGTIIEDPAGDDYIYVAWFTEENRDNEPYYNEDLYAQRITLNNCTLGTNCGLYSGGVDKAWIREASGDHTNVRGGILGTDSMDTVLMAGGEEATYIYGALLLGFYHKDGIDAAFGNSYLETRMDGIDPTADEPSEEDTFYQATIPGTDPYKFVSFIQWQEDEAYDSGDYYDSAGSSIDFATLQDYDGSVTSKDINTLGRIYSINFSKTDDDSATGSDIRYFVSRTGDIWQEIDTFDTALLIGSPESGKDLEYTGDGTGLYYQIFLKSGDITDIENTPTVDALNITYLSDEDAPEAWLTAGTAELDDYYNSEFIITAEAIDPAGGPPSGSGVAFTDLYYRYSESGDFSGEFTALGLAIAGGGPYSWTCTPDGVDDWSCNMTGGESLAAAELPNGDGAYQIAACAEDFAGNKECPNLSTISTEDTTILDTQVPEVSSTIPQDGSPSVPPTLSINIFFDDLPSATGGIDTATVDADTLIITATNPPGPQITISDFVWSNGDLNLEVQHAGSNFINGTEYTVQILDGVNDKAGNELYDYEIGMLGVLYEFTFTAADGALISATKLITDSDETEVTSSTSEAEERLTYIIRLDNLGNLDATIFSMQDQIPIETDYVAGSADYDGTLTPGPPDVLRWEPGDIPVIPAGDSLDVTFQVDIKSDEELGLGEIIFTNRATGDYDYGFVLTTPFNSNGAVTYVERQPDYDTSTFEVVPEISEGTTADIDNTPAEHDANGREQFEYYITITNTGYGDFTDPVKNYLPDPEQYSGFDFNQDSYCEWEEEVGCNLPDTPLAMSQNNIAYAGDGTGENLGSLHYDEENNTLTWQGILAPLVGEVIIYYNAWVGEGTPDFPNLTIIDPGSTLDLEIDSTILGANPNMTSALAADDGGSCGNNPQAGDTVTLSFDIPTNEHPIDSDNIDDVLMINQGHTWGNISAIWQDSQTLVITFSDSSSNIEIDDTILIIPDTIEDPYGYDAHGSPPNISGTFGAPCTGDTYYLKFMTQPTSVQTDTWSDTIIVATVDAGGTEVDLTGFCGAVPVQLTSDSTTERFKDEVGNQGGDGFEITIPAGDTSTSFYYKDSTAGTFTMTAAETSSCHIIQPGTQNILVFAPGDDPVYEYELVFTTPAQEIRANEVSDEMKVQLQKK